MATSAPAPPAALRAARVRAQSLALAAALVAVVLAAGGAAADGATWDTAGWLGFTGVWAVAAAATALQPSLERVRAPATVTAVLAGASAFTGALVAAGEGGRAALVADPLALALLCAAFLHLVLSLSRDARRSGLPAGAVAGYCAAAGVGIAVGAAAPPVREWPVVLLAAAVGAVSVGVVWSSLGAFQARLLGWTMLGVAAAAEVAVVGVLLRLTLGWPHELLALAAAATTPVALGLVLDGSARRRLRNATAFVHASLLVALTSTVGAIYLAIVLALGHSPARDQGTLLALSLVAAAIAAVVYRPVRARVLRHGAEQLRGLGPAPTDLAGFGARLSRSVPIDEALAQFVESLCVALGLEAAEIWTGSGGVLERVASEPERGPASLRLAEAEEAVVARAGVSGPAWLRVWLPQLLERRATDLVRVAPIAPEGELYGLVVAEASPDSDAFDERVERLLSEVAREVGVALRNVRLDSDLRSSLEALRTQAEELRLSRSRIVAAADAERRRIERNLHDGAQQYLVGLAAHLRAAEDLVDEDPARAKAILDELGGTVQEAMEEFRDLAHGIYPPLLQERGLADALAHAARRMSIPARVEAWDLRRYDAAVEATIYFCCIEALQNAAKYAGDGANATVRVSEQEMGLRFEIADDGVGIDPSRTSLGAGLTNMRDRLGAIGGSLRIDSVPGNGTRVVGAIPLV